jgi:hypothetical protein
MSLTRPGARPDARRRPLAIAVLAVLTATAAAACGGGPEPTAQTLPPRTSSTSSTSTTNPHVTGTAAPGAAAITSFEVKNQISCTGTVAIATQVTYETEGAASVAFVLDGEQVAGMLPPTGAFDLPLTCDGRSHTVVLVAVDDDGGTTLDSRVVLTSTTPLGN